MPDLPRSLLDWLYNVLQPEYADPGKVFADVVALLSSYPSLSPKTAVYTDEQGRSDLLLCLHGILPTIYNGATYHIPVEIWVPKSYPLHVAPIIYVRPTADMVVFPSNYVDGNGRCFHPYLTYWNQSSAHNLSEAIAIFIDVFSRLPPVFAKPQHHAHAPPAFAAGNSSSSLAAVETPPPVPPKPSLPQYSTVGYSAAQPGSGAPAYGRASYHQPAVSQHSPYGSSTPTQAYHGLSHSQSATNDIYMSGRPASVATSRMSILDSDSPLPASPVKPPNPERAKALAELDNAIASTTETVIKPAVDMDQNALDQTSRTLDWAEQAISRETNTAKALTDDANDNARILNERIESAKNVISQARTKEIPPIDELVLAETVVYNQLYSLVAADKAIDDTYYVLDKALENDRMDLQAYMKHTRALAREQFSKRALVTKISAQIGVF